MLTVLIVDKMAGQARHGELIVVPDIHAGASKQELMVRVLVCSSIKIQQHLLHAYYAISVTFLKY